MSRLFKICTILITLYASGTLSLTHPLSKRLNGIIEEGDQITCEGRSYTASDAFRAAYAGNQNLKSSRTHDFPFNPGFDVYRYSSPGPYHLYPLLRGKTFSGKSYPGLDYVVMDGGNSAVAAVVYGGERIEDCFIGAPVQQEWPGLEFHPNEPSASRDANAQIYDWYRQAFG